MSAGGQKSNQSSASQTFIDPMQQGFLSGLWSMAQQNIRPGAIGNQAQAAARPGAQASGAALGALTGTVQNPLQGQQSVLTRLSQLGNVGQQTQAYQPALAAMRQQMNPTRQIQAQGRSLQSGLGEMFREELNPAIRGNAIAAGGFGGGRQGVAQGQAVGELADAYTQGLGDITANANAQALGASQGYAGILDSLRQRALQATGAAGDIRTAGQTNQLNAAQLIPQVGAARQGFGTAGTQSMMDALQQLAQIYGNPTILSQAQSGGKSGGWSFGFGG